MPKSSIASRTPSALSCCSRSSTVSVCCISTLSVISSTTAVGSTPDAASAWRSASSSPVPWSWRPEMLIDIASAERG